MGDDKDKDLSKEGDSKEDSIRVICRFRPLNDTEEKTGSKFIIKFPSGSDDQCVSISVRLAHLDISVKCTFAGQTLHV